MARLRHNYYPSPTTSSGLTLIEVLIALAIVGIAMTAVIKATSQNIRGTAYLQNKMVAMWVGQQALNEILAGMITIPPPPDKLKQTTTMLNREWHWSVDQEETPNPKIKKVVVRVSDKASADDEEDTAPVLTLESYLSHDEQ